MKPSTKPEASFGILLDGNNKGYTWPMGDNKSLIPGDKTIMGTKYTAHSHVNLEILGHKLWLIGYASMPADYPWEDPGIKKAIEEFVVSVAAVMDFDPEA